MRKPKWLRLLSNPFDIFDDEEGKRKCSGHNWKYRRPLKLHRVCMKCRLVQYECSFGTKYTTTFWANEGYADNADLNDWDSIFKSIGKVRRVIR